VKNTHSLQVDQRHLARDQVEIIDEEEVARRVRVAAEAHHAEDNAEDDPTLSRHHLLGRDPGKEDVVVPAADDEHHPQCRRSEASPLILFGPERGMMTDG
jgi:hypothetical protein